MKFKHSLILFGLGLGVGVLAAVWVRVPGYMDASYYYTTALSLARGDGFIEPYIWNYLGNPAGIPHPSHQYWMPLSTILAAVPLGLGGESFRLAQAVFVLLTACIPVVTSRLAHTLTGSRTSALQAGFLALIPGFYLPFFVTTDNFVVYALTGTAALYLMATASERSSAWLWAAAGGAVGLCHLARADGLLFIGPAILLLFLSRRSVRLLPLFLAGYFLLMAPWWFRNWITFGSMGGGAGADMVWMTDYNQLFRYPPDPLGMDSWLQMDARELIRVRLQAAGSNFLSLVAVNGAVVLGPLMVLGGIKLWHRRIVRAAAAYLVVLYLVMSFVFPLAGYRGSFFHSGAALMPLGWALVPAGFRAAIEWGVKERGWKHRRAVMMFAPVLITSVLGLTIWNYRNRVVGSYPDTLQWEALHQLYAEVGDYVGNSPGITAVKDPPTFHAATGRPSVVIPYGGLEALQAVCERYDVDWVVLDKDHPEGFAPLYRSPGQYDWLKPVYIWEMADGSPIYLLEVVEDGVNK